MRFFQQKVNKTSVCLLAPRWFIFHSLPAALGVLLRYSLLELNQTVADIHTSPFLRCGHFAARSIVCALQRRGCFINHLLTRTAWTMDPDLVTCFETEAAEIKAQCGCVHELVQNNLFIYLWTVNCDNIFIELLNNLNLNLFRFLWTTWSWYHMVCALVVINDTNNIQDIMEMAVIGNWLWRGLFECECHFVFSKCMNRIWTMDYGWGLWIWTMGLWTGLGTMDGDYRWGWGLLIRTMDGKDAWSPSLFPVITKKLD